MSSRKIVIVWIAAVVVFSFSSGGSATEYTVFELSNNTYDDRYPSINGNGYVVWEGWDGSDRDILSAVPCSVDDDNDDDGYVSASCGGDDCHDSNPNIYPTNSNTYCNCVPPYPQGTDEICGDGADNDCSGTADDKDQDGDGSIDEECGGDDCSDSNPHIYPTNPNPYCNCESPYPQGNLESIFAGNCADGIDNDCDGLFDTDPECAGGPCAGSVEASTLRPKSMHGPSNVTKHVVCFLLPLGVVIALRIGRRK